MDRRIINRMAIHKALLPGDDIDRQYVRRKKGVQGLTGIVSA